MQEQKPNLTLLALARKWLAGKITSVEQAEFDSWYNSFDDTQHELVSDEGEQEMAARLKLEIFTQAGIAAGKRTRLWPRIAAAAAVLLIVAATLFYYTQPIRKDPASTLYASDIAPGKNTATLTLANGKVIKLSDAKTGVVIDASKLTYNDGSSIIDSIISSSISLTASTPRGGTYQVILADGTKVWLNAASKLTFPKSFANAARRIVQLTGEAYFEVSKDAAHPFMVMTDGQEVQVLGTHFNVNAYQDEGAVKTTLLEGSVKVSALNTLLTAKILKPGEQSVLTADHQIRVNPIDVTVETAWRKGDFVFRGTPLEDIMMDLSRWYDIEVKYEADTPKNLRFGAYLSRFKPISVILERFEKTGKVKFKIEGRTVIVMANDKK